MLHNGWPRKRESWAAQWMWTPSGPRKRTLRLLAPRALVSEPDPKRSRLDIPVSLEPDPEDERPDDERPTPLTRVFSDGESLPKGIHVILLGGSPGSGVKTSGKFLFAALETYGATVTVIDDADYHVRSPPCPLCLAEHVKARLRTAPSRCFACQSSLETEALFPTIVHEAQLIVGSTAYSKRPLGFVIVHGRRVVGCAPLVRLADGLVFYLAQQLPALGHMRHLKSLGQWDLLPTDADNVIEARIEELMEQNDHQLWLLFEHYRLADAEQKKLTTRIVMVNNKTTIHVADDLNAQVQQRLIHTNRIVIKGATMEPSVHN